MPSNGLKIRCPLTKSAAIPRGKRGSIKGPISVPVSPSNAVECYPCREVTLNYNRSLLFHGGDTGSTPVRDANILKNLDHSTRSRPSRNVGHSRVTSTFRIPSSLPSAPADLHQHLSRVATELV